MQKWEHLFVICVYAGELEWKARWYNGQELKDWRNGPNYFDLANQLGEDGWELTGFNWVRGISGRLDMVFKRPKS